MTDDSYVVTRTADIKAEPKVIYEQLANFRNWQSWSPWEGLDPELHRTYSGAASGVGATYTWSGNRKAGQGQMQIADAAEPGRVQIDLRFEKPFKAQNEIVIAVEPVGDHSHVTWTMTGQKTFATKVMGLFKSMDAMIGPDFERGLAQLKVVTEQGADTA